MYDSPLCQRASPSNTAAFFEAQLDDAIAEATGRLSALKRMKELLVQQPGLAEFLNLKAVHGPHGY